MNFFEYLWKNCFDQISKQNYFYLNFLLSYITNVTLSLHSIENSKIDKNSTISNHFFSTVDFFLEFTKNASNQD